MRLSAELFEDFARSLEPAREVPIERERRRARRMQVTATVPIRLIESAAAPAQTLLAKVRDFSPRGVGVLLATEVVFNQQFVLHLKRGDESPVAILCRAIHCREISPHLYHVGAEFTCVLRDLPVLSPGNTSRDDSDAVKRIRRSMLD